ncbi:MAG: hypothetical protein R3D32_11915 [Nitratireductor sp.]
MSHSTTGFRSRNEIDRETALIGRYRKIGIAAVAAAKTLPQQQAGQAQSASQFGWMAEAASRENFTQQG